MDLEHIKKTFNRLSAEREIMLDKLALAKEHHEYWSTRFEKSLIARDIINETAKSIQNTVEKRLSSLVSKALESIFEYPYNFIVEFVRRRNQIECELLLERNGEKIKPFDSVGGGVIDIISFACRIAFWSLKKTRPIIILDEPFKNLSKAYQPAAGEMLKKISSKLGIQIILTTHINELADIADNVIELRKG